MLPFGVGFSELMMIMVVVLLVVGPQKLPEIARTLGKGLRTVRRAGQELRDAIELDEIKRSVIDEPRQAWKDLNRMDDILKPASKDSVSAIIPKDADHAPPGEVEDAELVEPTTANHAPAGAVPRGALAPSDELDADPPLDVEDRPKDPPLG